MGINTAAVQRLYIAYFNRPADPVGLAHWEGQLSSTVAATQAQLTALAAGFSGSAEYIALYAGQSNTSIVNNLYLNLFGRPAETAGLLHWAGRLTAGTETFASVALQLTFSAQGTDATAIANKLAASAAFTAALDTSAEIIGYSGTAAADSGRTYLAAVTDVAATLTTATAGVDAAVIAAVAAGTAASTPGSTFTLTPGLDAVNITTVNSLDIVKGVYANDSDVDTFTFGDSIAGNGKTALQLVVDTTGSAPYVEMSGVDKISIIAATSGSFAMDAGSYGTDISSIALSGKDGFVLNVNDLTVKGSLNVSIAAASDSDVNVNGVMGGIDYSVQVDNSDADSVGSVVTAGTAGINIALGEDDYAYVNLDQSSNKSAAAVSVGDLSVGAVVFNLGIDADASVEITNYAYNSGKGSATAGSVTIGNINATVALSADVDFTVYNSATANNGAATVGNIKVGDINWTGAGSAGGEFEFFNDANSTNGNATAGNITIGNITVKTGANSNSVSVSAENTANANTSGNAKVGNITVGNLDYKAGNNFDSPDFSFDNNAYADKGSATTGNIVVGKVSLVGGNNGGEIEFTAANYASAVTGAATVGSVTIGDINLAVGSNSSMEISISNEAYTDKGAANVGAVTIGNITGTAGIDSTIDVEVDVTANGTAGDTVGNVTVGNVNLYGEPNANLSFEVSVSANAGSVADVKIGNVTMAVDNDGSASFELDVWAQTNIGNVTVGNVSFTLGSGASIDTFSIDVHADTGDIASFSIGNVTIVGAANSYDDSQGFTVYAGDDIGDISIGNVTVTAGKSATFNSMTWGFEAGTGNIGNISVGKTTLTAGENADINHYLDFTADNEIAGAKVGDIALSAAKNGSVWLSHDYSASDDIGNIVYGNISAVAKGLGASAGFSFEADANGNTIGTVTFGNVSLTAVGANAWAGASIWLSDTGDTVGLATVGDITLSASNVKAAAAAAWADFTMDSNGSIKIGNISAIAGAATADFVDTAMANFDVDITSGNNLTVGNIVVTGGLKSNGTDNIAGNGDDVLMDNLNVLTSWLSLTETGSGSITIGNVDYSGYKAAATIDVSGFKGAANITAAQGATIITDNKAKNVITLGAGNDDVNMNAVTSTTDKTLASAIDEIISFTSGKDVISIDTTSGAGSFAFVSSASADYATFLASAGSAMTNDGTDIYARKVGADMYVAIDADNGGGVDFVIKLAGISTVTAADFNIV